MFAPTPPSAWASIAPGLLLLAVAIALWLLTDRRSRNALALAVAITALNVGLAVAAVPGDVLAVAVIITAAIWALVPPARQKRQRPTAQSGHPTTRHD